jgi:hypothetical protein
MSILNSAYETTACSSMKNIVDIEEQLIKAKTMGSLGTRSVKLNQFDEPITIYVVEGGNPFSDDIGFFAHPIVLKEKGSDQVSIVIDIRSHGSWSNMERVFLIRNHVEYTWSLKRAILNYIWLNQRKESLRDISNLPLMSYATLVGQAISNRFALDAEEQYMVTSLAAFFYLCSFTEQQTVSEQELPLICKKISESIGAPHAVVLKALSGFDRIIDAPDLCAKITERVSNVSLENFNIGTFFGCISGTWTGSNSRETLCVGMEHMPTWLTIVSSAITSSTYKRATLSKIIQKLDKKDIGSNFTKNMHMLLGGKVAVTHNGVVDASYESCF